MILIINIIKNELIKLFKRKKILFLGLSMLIITICIFALFYFSNGIYAINKDRLMLEKVESQISTLTESNTKEELIKKNDKIQSSLDYHYNLADNNFDWKKDLENKNRMLSKEKESISDISIKETIKTKIQINNYLIDNDIKPESKYSLNSFDFLIKYISILGNIFLFTLIALTISDIVSSEYTHESIQLILLRPVKKVKIVVGKIIAGIITVTSTILIFDLISFIISGLLFNFGKFNTPVFINPNFVSNDTVNLTYNQFITPIENTTSYMNIGNLAIKAIILQLLFIFCCVIFCTLISLLFKSTIISLSFSVLIPIISLFTYNFLSKGNILKYISFIFSFLSDPISIITKDFIINTGATYINFTSCIGIFIIWIIFLFISTLFLSKRLE